MMRTVDTSGARAFRFVSRTKLIMTRPFKESVQIINDTVQFSYSWIFLFSVSLFAALPGRGPGVVKKRKKLLTLKPRLNEHMIVFRSPALPQTGSNRNYAMSLPDFTV